MELTTALKLKPEVIELIKKSLTLKNRLQFELTISYLTLQRWLKANHENLTKLQALTIISEELKMKIEDLLTA